MLESLDWLPFDDISLEDIVHAFITKVLAARQNETLETEAHAYFGHEFVVHFFAGVERDVQVG